MNKPPPWLAELHRLWLKARGGKLGTSKRPFSRDWVTFLNEAGVKSGVDCETTEREANDLEKLGRIKLKRHKYRKHLIEGIVIPLESESWLRDLFGSLEASQWLNQSLAAVAAAETWAHPRFPVLWQQWCERLRSAFKEGRGIRPFHWRQPEAVRRWLEMVQKLTEIEWPGGTSMRIAGA